MSKQPSLIRRLALPAGLAAMTAVYAAEIPNVRSLFGEGFVDTRFLPKVLVIIAACALVAIVWREIRAGAAAAPDEAGAEDGSRFDAFKPFILFAALLAYIAAFRPLGFLACNIGLSVLILWLFGYGAGRPLVRVAAALGITGAAYLLFAVAFGTRLPLLPGGF